MIEAGMSPEITMGIQSLGLLLIGWRFSHLQKETIKANYNDRCAVTGTKRHLEVHHRICCTLGGADVIENGVPLTTKVHKEWDRKTLEEGIVYPGIRLDEAPVELFKNKYVREKTIYKYKQKGIL